MNSIAGELTPLMPSNVFLRLKRQYLQLQPSVVNLSSRQFARVLLNCLNII